MKHGITLALASTVFALALTGCDKGGNDIATVNGDSISADEFYDYLETKSVFTVSAGTMGQDQMNQVLTVLSNRQMANLPTPPGQTPGMQALRDLVTRQVVLQMAKAEGFEPTKEDIDKEINFQKELEEAFVKNLQQNRGMSMEQIRRQIGFELAQQHLITKGITVTDKDVEDYIEANKERQFTEPATVTMTLIAGQNEAARKRIDDELAKGRRLEQVANDLNGQPGISSRNFSGAPILAFGEPLVSTINNTANGSTSNWVLDDQGNGVKLFVATKTEAREITINDARKEQVRRQLAVQRGSQGKDFNKMIFDKVVEAEVDLKKTTLKSMWTRYKDELKKEKERLDNQAGVTGSITTPEPGQGE